MGRGHRHGRVGADRRAALPRACHHPAVRHDDGVPAGTRSVSDHRAASTGTWRSRSSKTGPRSWAETDLKSLNDPPAAVSLDESKDKKGPIPLGSARVGVGPHPRRRRSRANRTRPSPNNARGGDRRLRLRGQRHARMPGNRDLFMNTIAGCRRQDNLISIRPKEPGRPAGSR